MDFYAASIGDIKSADLAAFARIREVLAEMPNIVFDPREQGWDACKNQVSCHLVCRALADYFPVSVRDGYFTHGYQHSWLVPYSGSSIIDAYPVGGAAPFVVSNDRMSPWRKLYQESDRFLHELTTDQFRSRLEKTVGVVGETIKRLGFG